MTYWLACMAAGVVLGFGLFLALVFLPGDPMLLTEVLP